VGRGHADDDHVAVPRRNRVTPFGSIEALAQRGRFLGNRGALYRDGGLGRPWNGRRWICCVLSYKGWRSPPWGAEGRWTALFFLDEAVALAAGHRPCALCRRADYDRFRSAWGDTRIGADALDRRLHADRLEDGRQRRHRRSWGSLPDGAYVVADGIASVVDGDALRPWGVDGYGPPTARPTRGDATVLTPSCTVDALLGGYRPATGLRPIPGG
jgi:hypothetical protein